jgi:hypothetical protein
MPTEAGYQNELLAQAIVSSHLNIRVEHTGMRSDKPDLLVRLDDGGYEIDVTLAVEQWRMKQHGTLYKNGDFELREIPDMSVSLFVQMGQRSSIKALDAAAMKLAELVLLAEVEWVDSADYYKAGQEAKFWGITESHQELLKICQELDLQTLQRYPGQGQLIRITTGFGGSWGGGVEEFNDWLSGLLETAVFKQKILRSLKLASGPLGLFIWLDSSVSYGAHEWLDRGIGIQPFAHTREIHGF